MSDFGQLLEKIDAEAFVEDLGCDTRSSHGQSGRQINVKECPRCHGNKWKVFLNADTGLGNCFHGSCVGEAGFSLYTFALNVLGNKREVMKLIELHAGKTGWRPKRKAKKAVSVDEDWESQSLMIPTSCSLPFKNSVGTYLKKRGFENETVALLKWRYCLRGKFSYKTDNGFKNQDFSKRILIPVFDLDGDLVSFQGRDITGESSRKYMFPSGLPSTALFLYNGNNAVGAEHVVINEGALDVAATIQAFSRDENLKSVIPIGTFGKVLSDGNREGNDQLGALMTLKTLGLKIVTLMWDSEPKTIRDMCKAAKKLTPYGFKVRIALLPSGCDPNEAKEHEVRSAHRNAVDVTNKLNLARFMCNLPTA